MNTITGPRREAKSGNAKTMVIFLHGYGADGNDLIGLADPLSDHLPDTVFLSPHAPQPCANNPAGFQWFPIPWLDGSTEGAMKQGFDDAVIVLNDFLNHAATSEGIAAKNTVIVGFSQGTMMALHVLPRRKDQVAGIVGFSGRLLEPENIAKDAISKPPVLLVHGDADQMVPPASLPEAADALSAAGFEVYTHTSKGLGHGIDNDGLSKALQFIQMSLA